MGELMAAQRKIKSGNKMSRRKIIVAYSKDIRKGIRIGAVLDDRRRLIIVGAKAESA